MQSSYEFNDFVPLEENKTVPRAFHRHLDRSLPIYIGVGRATGGVSYSDRCSLTVECTITLFREPVQEEGAIPVPSVRFISDEVPELDEKPEAVKMAFAENLLSAAGRYGLDRLKVACERRIALGMDISTVASMLVLAEQQTAHG